MELVETPVFSVGEFLDYVNELFSPRTYVVEGEISEFRPHPTGAYFSLKDKEGEGILNCYMNPFAYRSLGVILEDGMCVKARGAPKIYKPKGRFSFVADSVELSGEGTLRKAYEALKKKLEDEGLFSRKREIPEFISRIGIITSKTGAVIDDFRKNLKQRGLELFLYDVRVEGAQAHTKIAGAIRWFNTHAPECDVLVLIRGGGSLEDLQPFNNELVAREIFSSRIPVIAGIGHDRDVPIASMASDYVTSTPSFAAILVNESWKRIFENVPFAERRILDGCEDIFGMVRGVMTQAAEKFISGIKYIRTRSQGYSHTIVRAFSDSLLKTSIAIANAEKIIGLMDPKRNLRLGYSIIYDNGGRVLKSVKTLQKNDVITASLADGSFEARIEKTKK